MPNEIRSANDLLRRIDTCLLRNSSLRDFLEILEGAFGTVEAHSVGLKPLRYRVLADGFLLEALLTADAFLTEVSLRVRRKDKVVTHILWRPAA